MSEENKEKEKQDSNLIICVGNDKNYWHCLKRRFIQRYEASEDAFDLFDLEREHFHYPEIFLKIVEKRPKVIFLDFTSWGEQKVRLAQLLSQDNATKDIALLGLVMTKEEKWKCFVSGIKVVHIKSGEYHDVVYTAAYLSCKSGVTPRPFAKVTMKDKEINLIDDFRVGYIAPDYIHMEGNLKIEKGQEVVFDIKIPNGIVSSKKFIVKDVSLENHYYNFKYTYNLSFVYVDEQNMEGIDCEEKLLLDKAKSSEEEKYIKNKMENKRKNININYLNQLEFSKRKLEKWVLENMMYSKVEKKTKILIVDKKIKILRECEQFLDTYPFSIRTQTYLDENFEVLSSFRPHLILFQHTSIDIQQMREKGLSEEDIVSFTCNEFGLANKNIQRCMDKVKSRKNYDPMIVVFNVINFDEKFDLEKYPKLNKFIAQFDYPLHMVRHEQVDINGLLEMGKLYEKKQRDRREKKLKEKIVALRAQDPVKYGRLNVSDFEEKRYYVASSNPLSYAAVFRSVQFLSFTESEVEIGSERELEMSTYRLTHPVPMSIKLVPVQEQNYREEGGVKIYKGLIHSIGELDKAEIRRQVNELFCASTVKQREKDQQNFLELNERKIKELEEAKSALGEEEVQEILGTPDKKENNN